MDFRRLELFLAVMEQASLTKAADKLHLSPGAVSLQMRNLANDLHCELFVKSGRRSMLPTAAAQRLAERGAALMRQVWKMEQEFENDEFNDTRPFHFATGATTLIHQLPRPLRALRRRYPRMTMQITVTATEEMRAGLFDRRYDLVRITMPCPQAGLKITPLYDEELLIVRPSNKAVRGWSVGAIQAAELERASFLLHSTRSNMRAIVDNAFTEIGVHPRIIMEAEDVEVMRRLVESGFGYSVLPESALRRQPRYFHVLRIPGHRIVRQQALATPLEARPRALTSSIIDSRRAGLAGAGNAVKPR